jgi:hypothetical protein
MALFHNGNHAGSNSEKCYTCGNYYDTCLKITHAGATHAFDCFECAIQALAPTCSHCACRIIGHGIEENGTVFCCAHCARAAIQDRDYIISVREFGVL